MEGIDKEDNIPRMTREEFEQMATTNKETATQLLEERGFTIEEDGRAKVLLDGELKYFSTDPNDLGTLLKPETVKEEGLE